MGATQLDKTESMFAEAEILQGSALPLFTIVGEDAGSFV